VEDGPDREEGPRTPTPDDLRRIAHSLNAAGARYAVIGGFALQYHGFARPTQDIDLLVDPSPENVERIRQALCVLADRAVLEVEPGDVLAYSVVRVADEVVVDLLGSACGVTFADVEAHLELATVEGTIIPYARPEDLLRTKDTVRPKDAVDRDFLQRLLAEDRAP
jgi:hypothetical protein